MTAPNNVLRWTQAALQELIVAGVVDKEWSAHCGLGDSFTAPQQRGTFHYGNTPSRFKGVRRAKHSKWRAKFCRKCCKIYLGIFDTEITAAGACKVAVAEYDRLSLPQRRQELNIVACQSR